MITARELLGREFPPVTEADCEADYRRGYCDGYVVALNAMMDLMTECKLQRAEAYEACCKHWQQALDEWQHSDTSKSALPPEIA